jgi:molybdenum cofactor biosynthesis enzyme MoaA
VKASHNRITFSPEPEEIAQVILEHFASVPEGVASFGQGCEGEPLLEWARIARAVSSVREKTSAGTINMNTNGSMPGAVEKIIDAGLDSIRISMNSPSEKYYTAYHRPVNYSFADVLRSIEAALKRGIFVSINLFFMPGFTDSEKEVLALEKFLDSYPVNMIQTRNMNMDPDLYFDVTGFEDSEPLGIRKLVARLRGRKGLRLGYYNPAK